MTVDTLDTSTHTSPNPVLELSPEASRTAMANLRFVHRFQDRHGRIRYYFRHPKVGNFLLRGAPGSADFLREYETHRAAVPDRVAPGAALQPVARVTAALMEGRKKDLSDRAQRLLDPNVGVYLLLKKNKVVYVGMSRNLKSRIDTHYAAGRPFGASYRIPAPLEEMAHLERLLIAQLKPKQNRQFLKTKLATAATTRAKACGWELDRVDSGEGWD